MSNETTTAEILPRPAPRKELSRTLGARLAFLAVVVFTAGVTFGHFVPHELVTLPAATEGSLRDAREILRSNLTLLVALGVCAGFQRFARDEVEGGSRPWIAWLTTAFVCAFISLNTWAVGVVIGQLGVDALVRILPHAPLEIGAFSLAIVAFLDARADQLNPRRATVMFGLATALMLAGSLVETYISGGLS